MKLHHLIPAVLCVFALAACDPNSYFNDDPGKDDPGKVDPAPKQQDIPVLEFAKGADISWVTEMEQKGYKFYDAKGNEKELTSLMKELGCNAVRYRVWVDPKDGWCNKEDVLAKAKRAQARGMRIMIDFHYSDTWADPGKQTIPAAWKDYDLKQMTTALKDHTVDVLKTLKNGGVDVSWVQIGNETNTGMLWNVGVVSSNSSAGFTALVNAGYSAVKSVFPKAIVILHHSNGQDLSANKWFFDLIEKGGTVFDMIGLSLYPAYWDYKTGEYRNWETDTDAFIHNLDELHNMYGRPIMLVEFGMPATQFNQAGKCLQRIMDATSGKNWFKGIFYWEPEAEHERNDYDYGAFKDGMSTGALNPFLGLSPEPVYKYTPDETDPYPLFDMEKYGVSYVYDRSALPELHISVTGEQWNELLAAYDHFNGTIKQIKAHATYIKGGDVLEIPDAGLRLKGNVYSRRRPMDEWGNLHHCHYQINFRKWVKDDAHTVHGARKIYLKWFKDDPSYAREILAYDTFKAAKIWTASYNTYCRMYLQIEGKEEKYLGIYNMIEHLDEEYLKTRKALFGDAKGNLWKCRGGANFRSTSGNFGPDRNIDGQEFTYELKTNADTDEDYNAAKEQIFDFINNYNKLNGQAFHKWVSEHMDVPLFLRTYAAFVGIGFWDDYWNNNNNYYVYFNSTDKQNYKFYFIPYDCDNTFGIGSNDCPPAGKDPAGTDPFNWGNPKNPLVVKLLDFEDFREIYRKELLRVVDPENGILDFEHASKRVKDLQAMIEGLTANDTGEDQNMSDNVCSWSPTKYKLMSGDEKTNFFKAKASSIQQYCK